MGWNQMAPPLKSTEAEAKFSVTVSKKGRITCRITLRGTPAEHLAIEAGDRVSISEGEDEHEGSMRICRDEGGAFRVREFKSSFVVQFGEPACLAADNGLNATECAWSTDGDDAVIVHLPAVVLDDD